ncbi:MAG: hypothetical protein M1816_000284 [Peltula sp. TS41687]|nr:MAG: hypothetical protein M1816_000284 [Peltula sp. TS41687]
MVVDGQTPGAELERTALTVQTNNMLKSYRAGKLSAQDMKGIPELLQECIDEYSLTPVGEDMWQKYNVCKAARMRLPGTRHSFTGMMSHRTEMICRMFAHDLLNGDDMKIFEEDDALEDLVKGYKAGKASKGDYRQDNEGGAQSTDEIHLDVWMSKARAMVDNARVKVNKAKMNLGAIINKSKSSPSLGMPQGPGGSVVRPVVPANVLRRRSDGEFIDWQNYVKSFEDDKMSAEICAGSKVVERYFPVKRSILEIKAFMDQLDERMSSYEARTLPTPDRKRISDALQECMDEDDLRLPEKPIGTLEHLELWKRY